MHDQPENTSGITNFGRKCRSKASIDLTRSTGPRPRNSAGRDPRLVVLDPMAILGGAQR